MWDNFGFMLKKPEFKSTLFHIEMLLLHLFLIAK